MIVSLELAPSILTYVDACCSLPEHQKQKKICWPGRYPGVLISSAASRLRCHACSTLSDRTRIGRVRAMQVISDASCAWFPLARIVVGESSLSCLPLSSSLCVCLHRSSGSSQLSSRRWGCCCLVQRRLAWWPMSEDSWRYSRLALSASIEGNATASTCLDEGMFGLDPDGRCESGLSVMQYEISCRWVILSALLHILSGPADAAAAYARGAIAGPADFAARAERKSGVTCWSSSGDQCVFSVFRIARYNRHQ